jgi:hypothetical protein
MVQESLYTIHLQQTIPEHALKEKFQKMKGFCRDVEKNLLTHKPHSYSNHLLPQAMDPHDERSQ